MERPIMVFMFSSLLCTRYLRPSTEAMNSFVVVFPFDPVTATTLPMNRSRFAAPIRWRARRLSSTTKHWKGGSPPGGRSHTTPAAPRPAASSMNRWPSVLLPRSATKSAPGTARRESTTSRT
jgi:hypothetical protein